MRLSVVLENLEVPHLLPLRQAPQPTSRINLARLSHPLLRARTTTTDRQKHLTLPWDKTAETRQDRASWNNRASWNIQRGKLTEIRRQLRNYAKLRDLVERWIDASTELSALKSAQEKPTK
jgi:hypothetical protein